MFVVTDEGKLTPLVLSVDPVGISKGHALLDSRSDHTLFMQQCECCCVLPSTALYMLFLTIGPRNSQLLERAPEEHFG